MRHFKIRGEITMALRLALRFFVQQGISSFLLSVLVFSWNDYIVNDSTQVPYVVVLALYL